MRAACRRYVQGCSRWLLVLLLISRLDSAQPFAPRSALVLRTCPSASLFAGGPPALLRRRGRGRERLAVAVASAGAADEAPDADLASAWLDEADAGVLSDGTAAEVDAAAAHSLAASGAALLIDLRTARQFARGHPAGAASIPAGEPGPSGLLFHFREGFEADVE
ncbi:hypothetical protein EMIHUDRAFT_253202, partial [Emiliania huxleyi CCMP1516]